MSTNKVIVINAYSGKVLSLQRTGIQIRGHICPLFLNPRVLSIFEHSTVQYKIVIKMGLFTDLSINVDYGSKAGFSCDNVCTNWAMH